MLLVRPATLADADALALVHVRTWQSAYAGIVPAEYLAALDPDTWADRRRARMAEPSEFDTLVAEEGGRLHGFVTYGPYRHGAGAVDPTVGEILAIYVHPDAQGRGVGRALMDDAVAALAARGVTEVRLWVLAENAPSRRFYERYGLEPDGERDTFRVDPPGGAPVDLAEVRYALRVG